MRWLACLLVLTWVSCSSRSQRVGEDLDLDKREGPAHSRCTRNCQSVDWIDREVMTALADIAVCMKGPVYAPRLMGRVTVQFAEVPCLRAIAKVASSAGLDTEVTTQRGVPTVTLRNPARPNAALIELPKGEGLIPVGGGGGASGGGGTVAGDKRCTQHCAEMVRSCKSSCGWSSGSCVRSCEERYRVCLGGCSREGDAD